VGDHLERDASVRVLRGIEDDPPRVDECGGGFEMTVRMRVYMINDLFLSHRIGGGSDDVRR
jgi:hypothetical protein